MNTLTKVGISLIAAGALLSSVASLIKTARGEYLLPVIEQAQPSLDSLKLADLVATETGDLLSLLAKCEPDNAEAQDGAREAALVLLDHLGDDAPVLRNLLHARAAQEPQRACADTDLKLMRDANAKLLVEVLIDIRAGGRESFVATEK